MSNYNSSGDKHIVLLSIIIPVYNVEEYLEECLNSVVNQSIEDYEVIIVNDGSTDKSESIIDKFIEQYNFIKKVNKKNMGLGAARNTGIRLASGKYIGFIDSDDFIDKDMLKNMVYSAEENNSDIVMCDVELFRDKQRQKKWYLTINKRLYNKRINNKEVLKLYLTDRIKGFAWNKIYKRNLFIKNNILYEEGVYYEDIFTTLKLLFFAKVIYFINEPYYKYRQRKGNITSSVTLKHLEDFNCNTRKCIDFISKSEEFKKIEEYKQAFEISYMNLALDLYYKYFNYDVKKIDRNYSMYFKDYNYKINTKDIFIRNILSFNHKKVYIFNKLNLYVSIQKLKLQIKICFRKVENWITYLLL